MQEDFITSLKFVESPEYSERIESSLDLILKDLHSKWLLDEWMNLFTEKQ